MFHKILGYIAAAIIIVVSYGIALLFIGNDKPAEKQEVKKTIKTVKVISANPTTNPVDITMDGKLEALNKIELYSEVGGKVLKGSKLFKNGISFNKGEVLISLDSRDTKAALVAQRSTFQTLLTQILSDIKLDHGANYEAWNKYVSDFNPEIKVKALPEPKSEKEKRFLTTKNVYNSFYNIKSQEVKYSKYVITAPFSGVLTTANVQYGTIIRPGQKLGDFLQPGLFELAAPINVKDMNFIKRGDKVELTSGDISGNWTGTVSRISKNLDAKTQSAIAFISVKNSTLKEGMYLSGNISAGAIPQSIELPRKLINSDNSIYVVQDSKLAKTYPTIVKLTSSKAIITGVKEGELLLTQNFVGAYEGLEVTVQNDQNPDN